MPGLGKSYQSSFEYFADLGCPTEGTELTDSDSVKWPTPAGNDEAKNYRQKLISTPSATGKTSWVPVKVDVNNLRYHLSTKPLRAVVFDGTHFVALIGYDDAKQRFKFINSYGDRWDDHGYSYIPYSKVGQEIQGAEYLLVETPKPVPTARVSFKHSRRQNISIFLHGKQSTGAPTVKQIWPSGQRQDDSADLTLTVTLPVGFAWPPSTNNKLYLQVFDNGATVGGGDLVEFTAAFSGNVLKCKKLKTGAAHFSPNTVATFSIP